MHVADENTTTDAELDAEKLTVDDEDDENTITNQMEETTTDMDTKADPSLQPATGGESQTQLDSSQVKVKKTKHRRKSVMVRYMDHLAACSSVAKIFVYKWPPKAKKEGDDDEESDHSDDDDEVNLATARDTYLLQEQISEYLGVKSFKRKYPDIFRRILDIKEREFLKENEIVTETQCDLGLTALKLNDCLDLMAGDYPDKFKEFSEYLSETRRKSLQAKAVASAKRRVEKYTRRPKAASADVSDPMDSVTPCMGTLNWNFFKYIIRFIRQSRFRVLSRIESLWYQKEKIAYFYFFF